MSSPKQRIQKLKKDIQTLSQHFTTNIEKKVFKLPLQSIRNSQDQERDEIQQKINSFRIAANGREQTLQNQLKELQQKLRSLAIKKQNEVNTSRLTKDSYKNLLDKLRLELQKNNDEYQIALVSEQEKQRIHEGKFLAKAQVYAESLRPLEQEIVMLEKVKEIIENQFIGFQEKEQVLLNNIYMCKEDIYMILGGKIEYISLREEFEAKNEIFVEEYMDELGYFKEKDEYYKKIIKNTNMIIKYKEEVQRLQSKLSFCLVKILNNQEKLSQSIKDIESIINFSSEIKNSLELGRIEDNLSKKCADLDVEDIVNCILEMNSLEKFDIDEVILRLQYNEMRNIESQLRQEFEVEEKYFSESIIMKKYEKYNTENEEEDFRLRKLGFRNKMAAISQWKEEVEFIINQNMPNYSFFAQDKTIVQEFLINIGKTQNAEGKKDLETLANTYFNKVNIRYSMIQNYNSQLKEKFSLKQKYTQKKFKKRIEILNLQLETTRAKQQVQILLDKEKNIKSEHPVLSKNSIIQTFLGIKSNISSCDNLINSYTKSVDSIKLLIKHIQNQLQTLKRTKSLNKLSLSETIEDQKTTKLQIEKILEKQHKTRLSLMPFIDNDKLLILKEKVDNLTSELSKSNKQFMDFETGLQLKLTFIEQEESMLRSQQQALESALRNIEFETSRIKNMESHFKYDDMDAPNPDILLSPFRSKSALKRRNEMSNNEYFTGEIKDGNERSSIIEGNPYLELVVKPLGKKLILSAERNTSTPMKVLNKKYYRFRLEDITQKEKDFLDKIKPLLEGSEIYKKFITKSTAKVQSFEILDSLRIMPEQCGYALRKFFLHKSLNKIHVTQALKPGFESTISSDCLMAPILSLNTILVLKTQGHLNKGDLDYDKINDKSRDFVGLDGSSERFNKQCQNIVYYPFCIGLAKGENIELIAKGYEILKQWVNGINALVKYKKLIPKLKSRIEAYTTV
ncbi:hypothetical protein SteCoe_1686 [Stentor coeruleus]|uniref:PH domain-containing protein n=1 Tax=Stentor coeruleus TaxID=5963 RepID=A0A1R2D192_9CILI|nr:hypothetical protein SteCoe_1686 [Stentor coeruleus]